MKHVPLCLLAIAAMTAAAAAPAQEIAADLTAEELAELGADSIRRVIVYGNDACPPSTGDEIVVCARKPESERYRIPENLRDTDIDAQSWAVRAEMLEMATPDGLNSCSTVGPAGFTGCWQELMREYRLARRRAE